jgi:uncharacterized protein
MALSGFIMKTTFIKKILKGLGIIAGLLLIGYVLLILFFMIAQDFYIFEPEKKYHAPKEIGFESVFREIKIKTIDDLVLDAWLYEGDVQKPAILYLHGNNRELSYFAPRLVPYFEEKYTVLMVEYRGYGRNAGRPSEEGLITDALAGYKYLKERGYKVVVHGFSLGTGVALGLADKVQVDGVILEAPFYSMRTLVQETIPILPTGVMLRNRFPSNKRIRRLHKPLLVLHGTNDKTIPYQHSQKLVKDANETNKVAVFIENGTHLNLPERGEFDTIIPWLKMRF